RNRDVFVHDGSTLRRLRVSAPVQFLFLTLLVALIAFSGYSAARQLNGAAAQPSALPAATEARARQIEQRQALIEAALSGRKLTAVTGNPDALARVEQAQVQQAALVARALDVRYQVTSDELKRLGMTPARLGQTGQGGPFESISMSSVRADPTFKALFTSWKKLDSLQDSAIAVPSEKPIKASVSFTSGFGVRADPFQARAAMHPGIDLAGPIGTPIYATADGTVLRAGWNSGGYGNLVEIDHGKGIATRYGHMSAILVSAGQHIVRGQQIGRMGSTGRSTGSHLHYEVRIDGRPVNPIPFMKSTDYLLAMKAGSGASLDQVAMGGPKR
ncbi:MAG: M23 family metallopeptidase, partial [Pseudomonadota bacterium]|nr:M23 family metallopeptidase [Pseudomonadota bacterium]